MTSLKISSTSPKSLQELFQQALQARQNSHSPYSGCKVGAALRTTEGKIYSGCNVENASYGGSICAEQSAIVQAVSLQGKLTLQEILVVTDANPPWPPCGICRQVISEFGSEITLHLVNLKGEGQTLKFQDLFPQGFTPENLR